MLDELVTVCVPGKTEKTSSIGVGVPTPPVCVTVLVPSCSQNLASGAVIFPPVVTLVQLLVLAVLVLVQVYVPYILYRLTK